MADRLRKAEVWVIFGWWGVTFITANCINKCIVMWCNLLAVKAHLTRSQTVSSLCVKLFQYPKSASNLVMCLKYFASGLPTRSGSLLWNGILRGNNTLVQLWFLLSTILKRLQFARLCPNRFSKRQRLSGSDSLPRRYLSSWESPHPNLFWKFSPNTGFQENWVEQRYSCFYAARDYEDSHSVCRALTAATG